MAMRRRGTMYTADRRLYLDNEGKVCEASSSRRARLLVPAGGQIPMEQAERLGLVEPERLPPGMDRDNFVSVNHRLYKFMVDEEPGARAVSGSATGGGMLDVGGEKRVASGENEAADRNSPLNGTSTQPPAGSCTPGPVSGE